MDFELMFVPGETQKSLAVDELRKGSKYGEKFGLVLTDEQLRGIVERRYKALADTGRVEFGGGVAEKLIYSFCDSPYISQSNYEETIIELQDLFYQFKNEFNTRLSDDELIEGMRGYFDNRAQGSLTLLAEADYEALYHCFRLREGDEYGKDRFEDESADSDEDD